MVPLSIHVDPSFYQEEEKCGFLVTKERKELWAVEIDLLMQLDRVCQEHGLQYTVGAGTLLGAVRHKGFIPWDDDIDVYLLREDYDILITLSNEFQYPYFLQTSYTEKNLLKPFIRLRNSQTTGQTKQETNWDINKGIFIDIFPLDGISPDSKADSRQKKKRTRFRSAFICFNYYKNNGSDRKGIRDKLRRIVGWYVSHNKKRIFDRFENNMRKYSVSGIQMWGNRTLTFDCPRSRRPYEEWKDLIRVPFEFVEVPIPRNYDAMLKQQYGDYMKIPEDKGGNIHGELMICTDTAFDQFTPGRKDL